MALKVAIRRSVNVARSSLRGKTPQLWKKRIVGTRGNDGWIAKLCIYAVLSCIAFLYLQPVLYMISTMLKNLVDLLDPTVQWFPRVLEFENVQKAWKGLRYPEAFFNTLVIALFGSIFQVLSCAVTGYALARLKFPGKKIIFALVILTFLVPPQIIIIPLFIIFSKLGWLNTPLVFLVPALFGQGIKSALFILIFRQFFKSLPAALEEAAKIDGASTFRLFARIMLPLARSGCLVVFLFSFIWYWNQYYQPTMFLTDSFIPLSIRLNGLEQELLGVRSYSESAKALTEGVKMAGAFLIILPPLLLYLVAQRWFVEGIEKTGLVE
ncbi:carbohydrate ABC transporter permease [Paenibacillus sp. GCM10027626]|uniref:carbohydrate ABC transporter permease n=1 Tax=Paenibacillus sp. GCM10027626 TaxID=3273411 RepID=UPI00364492A5